MTDCLNCDSPGKEKPAKPAESSELQPEIMKRAFTLPVVSDTYTTLARLSSPLHPYLERTVTTLDSGYTSIKSSVEEKMPEAVSTRLATAKEQAKGVVGYVDASLCNGLDQLVDKVPVLKEATPTLYAKSKTTMARYASLASTYLASFTLAQLALRISHSGLQAAGTLLKLCPGDTWQGMATALGTLRDNMDSVRMEGAQKFGTEKVKALQDVPLMDAIAEVLCLRYWASLLGGGGVTLEPGVLHVAADETDKEKTRNGSFNDKLKDAGLKKVD